MKKGCLKAPFFVICNFYFKFIFAKKKIMTRTEIISQLKKYFHIKELVCPHVYAEHGERAWMFLATAYLHTLLILRRDILKVPLVCNTKVLTQRGLRCNLCDIVKEKTEDDILYLSAHHLGIGGDLSSPEMTAEEMRTEIEENKDFLPYPVRMENDVNWLHIDCYDTGTPSKITYFNP